MGGMSYTPPPSSGSGGIITASNGLNVVGSDVRLGGTITQDTAVNAPANTLILGDSTQFQGTLFLDPANNIVEIVAQNIPDGIVTKLALLGQTGSEAVSLTSGANGLQLGINEAALNTANQAIAMTLLAMFFTDNQNHVGFSYDGDYPPDDATPYQILGKQYLPIFRGGGNVSNQTTTQNIANMNTDPAQNRMYRINLYGYVSSVAGGSVTFSATYTDGNGNVKSIGLGTINLVDDGNFNPLILFAESAGTISIDATVIGTIEYSAGVVIEEMV